MHHYALILAAGAASRMGRCKALLPLPFPDGDCCALERLARMYAFCGQRFVVTGHHAGLLEPVAPGWGLRAVRNPRPEDGMFSSICAGLQAVLEQARADGVEPEQGGVFVHPVDVPLTRRLTLLALLRTADAVPGTALQAVFCGEPGHPVYLPLSLVPAILAHDGREGLRGALASVPCRQVPVADAAMLLDMDTPEQYADLQDRAACHDALTRDEAEGLLLQAGVPERGLRHALAVVLCTAGGLRVTAMITDESCKSLGLSKDMLVTASIKAPWIIIEPDQGQDKPPVATRNCFRGTVERVRQDEMLAEILVNLPDGSQACALHVRGESPIPPVGSSVWVIFKALSVILTLD